MIGKYNSCNKQQRAGIVGCQPFYYIFLRKSIRMFYCFREKYANPLQKSSEKYAFFLQIFLILQSLNTLR